MYLLSKLGLGACLADDMGLGKTIQVLALLLVLKREETGPHRPSLLVAPASLLANWKAEAERLAPGLRLLIAHPSAMPAADFRALDAARLNAADLVITSHGSLLRQPLLEGIEWRVAVMDDAQAIKKPEARQTRQVKKLKAQSRIALTGTPVENRLPPCGPFSISPIPACSAPRKSSPSSPSDWPRPSTSDRCVRWCSLTSCAA